MPKIGDKYYLRVVDHDLRAETGPLQFGEDWPGVFIRGDEAIALSSNINLARCGGMLPSSGPGAMLLQEIVDLLNSCVVKSDG
jgi:hypothetical protein